jgi:hypothetical protein
MVNIKEIDPNSNILESLRATKDIPMSKEGSPTIQKI